jgi:GntR family transcriptional regulator
MEKMISDTRLSYQPLYEQIKRMLVQNLIDAKWKAGELIPSEQELAANLG